MKKYYYKDGTEVKVGDITFYSEYDDMILCKDDIFNPKKYPNIITSHKATLGELTEKFKI